MRIMLVAGEASGDMHGAHLAEALFERRSDLRLFGMGGSMMQKSGVKLFFNPTSISAIGFIEVLRSVQVLRRVLARFGDILDRQSPDAVVLIDFPEFNMRLANMAKARGIPIVYYFSPSAWAWRKGRARTVAEQATTVCAVFPFEAEVYRAAGAHVDFVGHPLVDIVKPSMNREEAQREFGVQGAHPVVALLPGSRRQEIDNHLTPMLAAARKVSASHPGAAFLLPLAHTINRERVEAKAPSDLPLTVVEGRTYDVLQAADAGAAALGTVCLEAALVGTPILSLYRTSSSTYWVAKRLYKKPYLSLPNIIAERHIIDELLQDAVVPDRIARGIVELLDPARRSAVAAGYDEVKRRLGGPGAVGRAAEAVLKAAGGAAEPNEGGRD